MPTTVNGVGSRYIGRKNPLERPGTCAHCGRAVQLVSYDTRTWFVLLYVPVIPLGKQRVVDQCPRCTRHQAIDATRWQSIQVEHRNRAEALLRQRPEDPRAAMEAHTTLKGAQLVADADALASAMESKFSQLAEVRVYLADSLAIDGRSQSARAQYAAAHRIDPTQHAAREALAFYAAKDGEVDEALVLLAPVLAARVPRASVAGRAVAKALADKGRQAEALPILKSMLESFPTLSADKTFAAELRACEKATGSVRTPLAANARRRRWIAVIAGVVLLTVAAVIWADVHAGSHMTLHVVNSVAGELHVDVPGAGSIDFRHAGHQGLELGEGTYTAHVRGAVERDVAFTLKAARWPRFLDDSVFVLDASGASVLCVEHTTYSTTKEGNSGRRYEFGKDFVQLNAIDFAFIPFPERIKLDADGRPVTRTRVSLMEAPVEEMVYDLVATNEGGPAYVLAEWALAREPNSNGVLAAFVSAARAAHFERRADVALERRLAARPVDLDAHLAWQQLHAKSSERESVAARYARLCADEPNEGAWWIARALVSTSASERMAFFTRATHDERTARLAWTSLGAEQVAVGDPANGLDSARHALDLDPTNWNANSVALDAQLALGSTEDVERSLDEWIETSPCSVEFAMRRVELLARSADAAAIGRFVIEWEKRAAKTCPSDAHPMATSLRLHAAWARGDFEEVVRLGGTVRDGSLDTWVLMAKAALGDMRAVRSRLAGTQKVIVDPFMALGIAVACRAAGDDVQAAQWERRGIDALPASIACEETARLLAGDRKTSAQAVLDLDLPQWEKSVVLALLSFSNEASRTELLNKSLAVQPRPLFPRTVVERLASAEPRR